MQTLDLCNQESMSALKSAHVPANGDLSAVDLLSSMTPQLIKGEPRRSSFHMQNGISKGRSQGWSTAWTASTDPSGPYRRQTMMDQAGALARALGRPGYGIQKLNKGSSSAEHHASSLDSLSSQRQDTNGVDHLEGKVGMVSALHPSRILKTIAGKPENTAHQVTMGLATLVALLGLDVYFVVHPNRDYDEHFFTVILVVMVLFAIEFCSNSLCSRGYRGSFFFYLDLVAILSLFPDVLILYDPLSFTNHCRHPSAMTCVHSAFLDLNPTFSTLPPRLLEQPKKEVADGSHCKEVQALWRLTGRCCRWNVHVFWSNEQWLFIARAGRTARLGTKIARVLRLLFSGSRWRRTASTSLPG
eukprot:2130751-Rhodomonas_salina.1